MMIDFRIALAFPPCGRRSQRGRLQHYQTELNFMKYIFSLCLSAALFAVSCKHKEKIAKTNSNLEFQDVHLGGDEKPGGMTAGKASEPETAFQMWEHGSVETFCGVLPPLVLPCDCHHPGSR